MLQPSRAQPGDAPPPPPPAAAAEASPGGAPAGQAPPAGGPFGGAGLMILLPLVMFGLIFFMNRSDKKRRQQIESGLKKGDRVVTRAGFIGKLVEVQEANVRVEIAPGVNVTMIKSAVEGLVDPDASGKASAKAAGGKQPSPAKSTGGKKGRAGKGDGGGDTKGDDEKKAS
ncbi:MAG: preprotein translocase subunit YajC [Myxococcota bacterium]